MRQAGTGAEQALATIRSYVQGEFGPEYAQVVTGDGGMDVFGLSTPAIMVNHAAGEDVWDLLVDVAWAASWAVLPVGCPARVTDVSLLAQLPEELQVDARVVTCGQDLLDVIGSV